LTTCASLSIAYGNTRKFGDVQRTSRTEEPFWLVSNVASKTFRISEP
jgi:hypothetical protein